LLLSAHDSKDWTLLLVLLLKVPLCSATGWCSHKLLLML
jgi:hypothetical protein